MGPMTTKQRTTVIFVLLMSVVLSGCGPRQLAGPTSGPTPVPAASPGGASEAIYKDSSQTVEARVEDLLSRMTLDEKIGQMTQAENNSIKPEDVSKYFIGSVLTGGDGVSQDNTLADWTQVVKGYQDAALQTRLAIPLIYGLDSVHGFAHVNGATVYPHNIGLGATRDADTGAEDRTGNGGGDAGSRYPVELCAHSGCAAGYPLGANV